MKNIILAALIFSANTFAAGEVIFDASAGSVIGETRPVDIKGQIPAWLELQLRGGQEAFGLLAVVGHQSNIDRNGNERQCNYYGVGADGVVRANLYYKATASKCFSKGDSLAESGFVFRGEFGFIQNSIRVTAFIEQAQEPALFAQAEKDMRVFGIKAGYSFTLFDR